MASWLGRSTHVITVSKHAKQEIASAYNVAAQKISVIYNGVSRENVTDDDIARVKTTYQLPDNYLLYVGNIEPRKNLSRLIAAYCLLPKRLQQQHPLVIVGGDGWNNQTILDDITKAQNGGAPVIKVQQFVPDADLPALYQAATALVHPALYEGFGMTPLEAMAQGTPVIAANNSSLPEVVGDAGLYVNATDTRDISAKIKVLLEDAALQQKLHTAGLARAKQFSWANTVADLARCIQNLGETHE
jgi:alpha-1,3-rhamnosyl/mannosyltransferase